MARHFHDASLSRVEKAQRTEQVIAKAESEDHGYIAEVYADGEIIFSTPEGEAIYSKQFDDPEFAKGAAACMIELVDAVVSDLQGGNFEV